VQYLRLSCKSIGFSAIAVGVGCSSTPAAPPPDAGPVAPALYAGEVCDTMNSSPMNLRFDPPSVVVAPNQTRPVQVTVEPDLCAPASLTFATGDPTIATAPASTILNLRTPSYTFMVTGGSTLGATSITGSIALPASAAASALPASAQSVTIALPVVVRDGTAPTCAVGEKSPTQTISGSHTSITGTGSLATATLSVPPGAFTRTDWLAIPPFPAQVACAASGGQPLDLTKTAPGNLVAIGPAVTFTGGAPLPQNQSLRREIDFAIPVNPASIPAAARMRHLQVLYQGPVAKTPRTITIASPRIVQLPGQDAYVLQFSSPWLGTFQAAFSPDAGTAHRSRHLTHRAVVGFSMGAAGAASFGMKHHDQFDVIAPMGGPSDWNWLLWFVEKYATGGFCPASQPNCTQYTPDKYPIAETYVHTEDWNHFWYEDGNGNGGHFSRQEYIQIFEDLALMSGDPDGQNPDPTLSFFPAGPKATDPFVKGSATGLPPGVDCRVTVAPISGDPNEAMQQQWQTQCTASRCDPKSTWVAPTGYYDATYNPAGTFPVISFCDGNDVGMGVSPYEDTWLPPTAATQFPVDLAFAVDLNGNGTRDLNEPVIRQGHEPWQDTGPDGLFDAMEPGYDPVTNPDPNQDDYDFQLNPSGTENNHHWDTGEPYQDFGIDGVQGTKQIAQGGYDFGEGDGKFTLTSGLLNFAAEDAHDILHQWSTNIPGGPMTDDQLLRFDVWSDGGVRDLFNFAAVANHLVGAVASRKAADGTQLRSTAFYNGFQTLPGQDPTMPDTFVPSSVIWADVADSPSVRYGTVDATPAQIQLGDGQHVGTAPQLLYRLESSLYWAAQHWPDADRTLTQLARENPETSTANVLGTSCEISGLCTFNFTGPVTKRTGPIVVQLPPGYGEEDNAERNVRYPIVYVLHGYGQSPSDLEAVAIVSTNFMNDEERSAGTRLAKFILVYVDGRCRVSADGAPECIQGTFYLNSNRPGGPQMDTWFDELVSYMDTNYRTMPASDVDVVE
jgi:hypothetical protein